MKQSTTNSIHSLYTFLTIAFIVMMTSVQVLGQGLPLTVLDAQSKDPLLGAHIYTNDNHFTVTTNEKGVAYIKGVALDEYLNFSYIGYRDRQLTLKEIIKSSDTIYLELVAIGIRTADIIAFDSRSERRADIANQVTVVDAKKIALLNPQNSADLLQASGAFVQKSQMGGGSPIIRGFEANKLLIVVDGVRLNNAIYRNGHLQNVITIDNAVLDRMEIIQGPASVIYGSDALGGVMHFVTKEPKLAILKSEDEIFEGTGYIRHSTANNERTAHLDFNYGTRKLAILSSLSYSNFGDLRIGANGRDEYPEFGLRTFYVDQFRGEDTVITNPDPLVQVRTGYWQFDGLQKVKYQYSDNLSFGLNLQYSTTSDVPRYDELNVISDTTESGEIIPKYSTWNYGPQSRFFLSLRSRYLPEETKYFDELNVILSTQKVDEDRIRRRYRKIATENQNEDVYVAALNADFTKIFDQQRNKKLLYGSEIFYNKVFSTAFVEFINGNTQTGGIPTRYPNGGSDMFSAAVYVNYRQKIGDKLNIMVGGRYTYTTLKSIFLADSLIVLPFTEIGFNSSQVTGSASLSYNFADGFYLDAVVSTAFRAPNVDDFGKVRSNGGYVTVPNNELTSEKSLNAEASLTKKIGEQFLVSGTYYYTYLFDAIVRDYFTLEDPLTGEQTNTLFIDGAFDTIQANVNAGRAYINGVSMSLQWNPLRNLQLKSSLNWVEGYNVTGEEPLAHIPPTYGQTSLTYETNKMEITMLSRYNGWKRLEDYAPGSSDNLDLATVDGMPSWVTYNAYVKYQLSPKFSINLACENIADVHYRAFSSGVSAPGRNFIFTLRTHF